MKKIILFTIIGLFLFVPTSFARDVVSDWYIKDFQAEIIVNKDSSLLITENIVADCGNLPDKHGIFRIIPTKANTPEKTIQSPIKLISITDFNGVPYEYSVIKNSGTITWKIGDANKTVSGINNYKIVYMVENTIRFDNAEFDEFYWNVLGNFWELEIENFWTKIIFPEEVNRNNTAISAYSGEFGGRVDDLTGYRWYTNNILEVFNAQILKPGQGITVSVTFPKNIFTPYRPGFFEKYSKYLPFFILIIVFIIGLLVWKKYGKDPKVNKTIIPEFEIPGNLNPLEMGILMFKNKFNAQFVSATIIDFAVKGLIKIQEIENNVLFIKNKDYVFEYIATDEQIKKLEPIEIFIINSIFNNAKTVKLSSLKNKFYKYIPEIKRNAKNRLAEKNLIVKNGIAFAMSQKTIEGAELNWRIKGFKLYMKTAEKYRQQFNEKENIFEKLLPYAMIFGLTKLWIKKFKQIYGEDYFATYHPIWFVGSLGSFDIDGFTSKLNSITSNISSSPGGSSGFGGGGFSGGGGGGGGGGGW